MLLHKAAIIGDVYYHVFQMDDGKEKKVACSEQAYKDLAKPGAGQPTIANGVWKYSFSNYKYNTVSGDLEDSMYAENGNMYALKLAGQNQKDVAKDKIINDVLII